MGFLRSNSDSAEPRPGARERARMRRRLRRQRQMREALLLDLGALVFELHRHGRREPELLQAKAAELSAVDKEVRALAEALGSDHTIMQLVATGVAGSCENCGALLSVDARYCASCGAPAVPALSGAGERTAFGREQPTVEHAALATGEGEQLQAEVDEAFELADEEPIAEEPAGEEATVADEQLVEEETITDEQLLEDEALAEEPPLEEEPPPEGLEAEDPGEDVERESIDEGVISVSRMPAREDAAAVEDEEPEAEEPVAEEPEFEEPVAEEPEDEQPEAEEPQAEEAGAEEFEDEEPEAEEPELDEPEAEESQAEEDEEPEADEAEDQERELDQPALERTGPASEQDGAEADGHPDHAGQAPRALADDALDTAAKAIRTGLARGREWIRGRRGGE